RLDGGVPLGAAGDVVDPVGAGLFVKAVDDDDGPWAGGFDDPGARGVLAVVEDRAEAQDGPPIVPRGGVWGGGRERAVAVLIGDGGALGAFGAHQDGNVDRPGGTEAGWVDHLDGPAVPLRFVAGEERPERLDVPSDLRPWHRSQAEHVTPGETRADGDSDPAGGELGERRDGSSVGHRVPEAGDQHSGTKADPLGAFGGSGKGHPHVMEIRRGVVEPRPLVAEVLSELDVVGRVERRRKRRRDVRGHGSATYRRLRSATAAGSSREGGLSSRPRT